MEEAIEYRFLAHLRCERSLQQIAHTFKLSPIDCEPQDKHSYFIHIGNDILILEGERNILLHGSCERKDSALQLIEHLNHYQIGHSADLFEEDGRLIQRWEKAFSG